ncbi:cell wall-binding repeat-containing protein [Clostridium kluyveri]|nr:cell wall-binding repeat-containing protein [Clostridium kluyveri]UZQ51009.1 cell wall-binding repeat-containing protein [Clostridium kluyveri]
MTKKFLGFIFAFAVILLFGINVKADSPQVTRLGGYDRYQTNTDIVNQMWEKSEYVVIVSGENFPDALSATVLAKKYNAPILLTYLDFYSEQEEQLDKLGVKKAFIIGGTGVVPKSIEDTLSKKGIEYERIYGNDRYETSVAVANKIGSENGIIVTTGSDYSDALSVSSIAGKLQMPIILSQKDGLEYAQNKFISENNIPKTYVLGSMDVISNITAYTFPNAKRIAMGNSRYDRNLDIINTFTSYID